MEEKHLHILWTNSNPNTSENMVMMYATNSILRGWWDKVTVILWGDTVRYMAEDAQAQDWMRFARKAGVEFSACVTCAENLKAVERITALDIELIPWGEPLTRLMQSGAPLLTV